MVLIKIKQIFYVLIFKKTNTLQFKQGSLEVAAFQRFNN